MTARTLSLSTGKPLIAVNHAVGHIELGCLLTGAKTPLVLLISGGHTMVVAHSDGVWRVLGETLDLTLGQLLDQLGRYVGFASPCGRRIEEAASKSNRYLKLPYTVKGNDVSFSGVLTAAKKLVEGGASFEDVCYSVQETAFAITTEVTERALAFTGSRELLVVGGVAANRRLAEMLELMAKRHSASVKVVPPQFSGDCGAQIAWTGLLAFKAGDVLPKGRGERREAVVAPRHGPHPLEELAVSQRRLERTIEAPLPRRGGGRISWRMVRPASGLQDAQAPCVQASLSWTS